jgi:hypothetical protein
MKKYILRKAIELAYIEALKSPVKNRYSAVIIYQNRIISIAHNTFKGAISTNSKQCLL